MASKESLAPLQNGEGFPFNYQPSRLDRDALFALNQFFDPEKISLARTQYHRSKLNITDLRNDLMEYQSSKASRSHTDAYYMVYESVDKDMFGDIKVVPLTHGAVAGHPNLPRQKSPGLPLKVQGYKTKGEALDDPDVIQAVRRTWYNIERNHDVELPDVACYARAQICGRDKNKVRATWGYPLTVYLTEGQYFYPLLDELKSKPQPKVAYGIEMGTGGMHYIESIARHFNGSNFLVGDWSRFDKTIPAWLIRDAFRMIARHIDFSQVRDVEGKLWPVKEAKSKTRWRAMVKYFIDTPIQLSSGERFIKHGGVPSGSCFTNLVDSIVNAIVTRYLIYDLTGEMPLEDVYLGDDIFAVTTKPLNLEVFAELAFEQFSMRFNPDKSYQTANRENIHFLGYYNMYGVPYKPVDTVIASSVYPERPTKNKFETITRLVGQAYSCFEPSDAKKFFLAAKLLQSEMEGLTTDMIEDFIRDHPHHFKYLSTLGVHARFGLKIPDCTRRDVVLLTLPQAPRRRWKPHRHDLKELASTAYAKWMQSREDF